MFISFQSYGYNTKITISIEKIETMYTVSAYYNSLLDNKKIYILAFRYFDKERIFIKKYLCIKIFIHRIKYLLLLN